LREMGVKFLRYPGGEKSDFHLFSDLAKIKHVPQVFGSYRRFAEDYQIMDFDAFMDVIKSVDATPHVVTGYDSFARTGITLDRYLENAVEWVRYANITKKYGVINWEIGNENWHNQTGDPEDIARIVSLFSREMKKIDPAIRIGASGNSREWWQRFLPDAADYLDFLTVSSYSCWDWKSYQYYADHPEINLMDSAETALQAIDDFTPEHKERLKVVISELNSMDYSEDGWPPTNDLGHALVTFEMIGQMLLNSRIEYGMVWNTRWMEEKEHDLLWYALDDRNELLPPGRSLAIWGKFINDQMVGVTRTPEIVTFASFNSASSQLNVFLLNKSTDIQEVSLEFDGPVYRSGLTYSFQGKGPDDKNPVWGSGKNLEVSNQITEKLALPPVSLQVISLIS
ncbi:hypothetical protein JW979_09210, partial [bacterium]|nr:hypothetical protein [candidate division CSSED10-310 bacterium]